MNSVRNPEGDPSAPGRQLTAVDPVEGDRPDPVVPDTGGGPLFDLGGVISAVTLFPVMVIVCAVLGLGAGLLAGYTREPTYTASTELLVGNLSISDPSAIPGAVGASRALASVYARLVAANPVQNDIEEATGGDPDTLVGASPVIESPMIRVTAISKSEDLAIAAANTGGSSLAEYVSNLRSPGSEVEGIVRQYRAAELRYQEKLSDFRRLVDRIGPNPSSAQQAQINEAQSDLQTAKLKRTALQGLYARGENIRVSQPALDVFSSAEVASNDRGSKMQLGGAIGLLAGLALGAGLATFRANRWVDRET